MRLAKNVQTAAVNCRGKRCQGRGSAGTGNTASQESHAGPRAKHAREGLGNPGWGAGWGKDGLKAAVRGGETKAGWRRARIRGQFVATWAISGHFLVHYPAKSIEVSPCSQVRHQFLLDLKEISSPKPCYTLIMKDLPAGEVLRHSFPALFVRAPLNSKTSELHTEHRTPFFRGKIPR